MARVSPTRTKSPSFTRSSRIRPGTLLDTRYSDTSTSPYKGILAIASGAGGAFEVGEGKTYTTLEDALVAVANSHITSPADEYEIKICSDLTLTSNLEIKTPGVKITSDNTTRPTIQGGSQMITVNPGEGKSTEIDNVNFSGLVGGINVASGELTINNSTVMNGTAKYTNSESNYAAGITVNSGTKLISTEGLVIDGCDNNLDNGHSGIYQKGGRVELTGATIKDCDNNNGSGGGIYSMASFTEGAINYMKLQNCTITNNTAHTGGGGIYCYGTTIEIKGGEISNNSGKSGHGGGVLVKNRASITSDDIFPGIFNMIDDQLVIKENKVNEGYQGGGICVESGSAKLYLNSSIKDQNNDASSTYYGNLCYIFSGSTILAGSNINETSWTSDTVLSSYYIAN